MFQNNVATSSSSAKRDKITINMAYELFVKHFYIHYQHGNVRQLANIYPDNLINHYQQHTKETILYNIIVVPSFATLTESNYMNYVKKLSVETKNKELTEHLMKNKIFLVIVNMAMYHKNSTFDDVVAKYSRKSKAYKSFLDILQTMVNPFKYELNVLLADDLTSESKILNFVQKSGCLIKSTK